MIVRACQVASPTPTASRPRFRSDTVLCDSGIAFRWQKGAERIPFALSVSLASMLNASRASDYGGSCSSAPRVLDESQGQVHLGQTGTLALRMFGRGQQLVATSIS